MLDIVCSRCVHLYVIDDIGSPPTRCPRCQEPLRFVCRETLTHLRLAQGPRQAPASHAARGRFRAAVRTRPEAPWIPSIAMEMLSTALVNAVDRAARGRRDEGYVCLIDGLRTAEASAAAGTPWGGALIRCYHELLDVYTDRYDICRESEAPREESPLFAAPLLAVPQLAIMDLGEGRAGPLPGSATD
jgi:hypothetical protein